MQADNVHRHPAKQISSLWYVTQQGRDLGDICQLDHDPTPPLFPECLHTFAIIHVFMIYHHGSLQMLQLSGVPLSYQPHHKKTAAGLKHLQMRT